MGDPAVVLFSSYGGEVHVPGQMEAPVLFEGQVSLLGTRELVSILHQLDGDVRGMEAAHVANQGVFFAHTFLGHGCTPEPWVECVCRPVSSRQRPQELLDTKETS